MFSLISTSVLTMLEGFAKAILDQHGFGLGFPFSFEGDTSSNLRATVIKSNGPDDDDAISINYQSPFLSNHCRPFLGEREILMG